MAKQVLLKILAFGLAVLLLVSCSNGSGSSANSGQQNGQLTFTPDNGIMVTKDSIRTVVFTLKNSTGIVNQKVNFSVSDPSVASVSPKACSVSSGSETTSSCLLTLYGYKEGSVNLIAQSSGYTSVEASTQVTNQVQYGTMTISGEPTTYTAYYPALESAPHNIAVNVVLTNSSGVTSSNALFAYFESSGSTFVFNPATHPDDVQQCQLTTETPTCTLVGTLTQNTNVNTMVKPVGSELSNYNPVPVTIMGTTQPVNGVISIGSQNSSNLIYTGFHAPLFVNWSKFNGVSGSVQVSLTTASNLTFYDYESGQLVSSTSKVCTLTPASPNCGFGLTPSAAGAAKINVSVSSPNNIIPSFESVVNFLVEPPATTGRTITFSNTTESLIVLGVTSGAASSYIGPNTLSGNAVSSNSHEVPPGAGSYCGLSNPQAACPIGSTCVQGGAVPESTTPYFCYWDKTVPQGGSYQIAANTSINIFISDSSGITSGSQQIQWSGNYHADPCNGSVCPAPESGFGTGAAYPAVSLAEVTYQHNTVDYYDVSIINGVNYAIEFGPNNTSVESDAYICGTAGSYIPQNGGWSPSNQTAGGLPSSSWVLLPTESAIVGSGATGLPASYFAVVTPSIPVESCTDNTSCTTGGVCGWNVMNVVTGTFNFESSNRTCGSFVSWATANQIYGWNSTSTNLAPFNLSLESSVSPTYNNVSAISVGNLQLCNNNTYSAYGTQPVNPNGGQPVTPTMACGGVNWNQVGVTRPSQQAVTVNSFWMTQVLPTITWLKQACPTCYTFPYDDMSSTFTCMNNPGTNSTNYTIKIHPLPNGS